MLQVTIKRVRIKFDKFLFDTGKAILIRIGHKEYWLGYFMCRDLVVNKKMGGHVSLTPETCNEKGIYYDKGMADVTITKHTPKQIINKNIEPEKELQR